MYRNREGYADPTAGAAIRNVMGERRKDRKAMVLRRHELKNRKRIYVASPYAGNVDQNVKNAIRYCRYVIDRGMMPVASHLLYPRILNDKNPAEREMGQMFGLSLMAVCDEVWLFGEATNGMKLELREAQKLGLPLRRVTEVAR